MNKKEKLYVKKLRNVINLCVIIIFCLCGGIVGSGLNSKAIEGNGYKMPVYSPFAVETQTHFGFTQKSEVNHFYLSDIFELNYAKHRAIYYSIGDVLIFSSLITAMVSVTMFVIAARKVKQIEGQFK